LFDRVLIYENDDDVNLPQANKAQAAGIGWRAQTGQKAEFAAYAATREANEKAAGALAASAPGPIDPATTAAVDPATASAAADLATTSALAPTSAPISAPSVPASAPASAPAYASAATKGGVGEIMQHIWGNWRGAKNEDMGPARPHGHEGVWANLRSDLGPNSSEAQRQAALDRALDILSK